MVKIAEVSFNTIKDFPIEKNLEKFICNLPLPKDWNDHSRETTK